ncbi:Cytidylyltransferase domain protein [mine drainage metagenome]|uniref:Cytidylyltransferase domain protein n=1 Tax=mine drainage metagenome TaxID=410659 RepID=T1CSH3_9ZZZZ
MARFPVVVLGGTFDRLHAGHEALLNTAFRMGRKVGIGLTTTAFLRGRSKPQAELIASYPARRRALAAWLRRHHSDRVWWIAPLDDGFGRSVEPGVSALAVSSDTLEGARAVNRERRRRGLPPVVVVAVPLVLADDLQPVSSRRVRARIIDRRGRRLSRIPIRVRAPREARPAVRAALEDVYPSPQIRWSAPGEPLSVSQRERERRRPSEIDLEVRLRSSRNGTWSIAIAASRIRLPAIRVRVRSAEELETAVQERLHPHPVHTRASQRRIRRFRPNKH